MNYNKKHTMQVKTDVWNALRNILWTKNTQFKKESWEILSEDQNELERAWNLATWKN